MPGKTVLPPTYLLIAILVMIAFHLLLPLAQVVSGLWWLVGLIPLTGGISLNIAADRAFDRGRTTVKPFEVSITLVTNGVFQISRHSMYLGFVLILLGIAVLLGSLTPYLVIPIFAILMDRVFIQTEEQMLEEQFGQTWLGYKARVRRWL
jgi:protein-S-isoprenylcysteine O-methyltransferase Ste14